MNQKNQANAVISSFSGQRLAVFGATGGTGRQTVLAALEAGHRVTVLVRDPARLHIEHRNLEVRTGNAANFEDVRSTIKGTNAVISCLGAPALSKSRIRSVGTEQIVRAMQAEGVKRLLAVSLLGAGDQRAHLPFFLRYFFFPLYLRRAARDHDIQERTIAESSLDWTIVRPPHLSDGPVTGDYAHGFGNNFTGLSLKVSRADVAHMMLSELVQGQYLKRPVGLSNRAEATSAKTSEAGVSGPAEPSTREPVGVPAFGHSGAIPSEVSARSATS